MKGKRDHLAIAMAKRWVEKAELDFITETEETDPDSQRRPVSREADTGMMTVSVPVVLGLLRSQVRRGG